MHFVPIKKKWQTTDFRVPDSHFFEKIYSDIKSQEGGGAIGSPQTYGLLILMGYKQNKPLV